MKSLRVAVNGLGRIGRAFIRATHGDSRITIVAVNDLGSVENLAYLLKYDTVYGVAPFSVSAEKGGLEIDGTLVKVFSEKDPGKLPWKKLGIDVVVESTGIFDSYEKAQPHIKAGAKRVVITAPSKDETGGATILMGVNEEKFATCHISSNGSCTTNAGSPLIAILDEAIGIERAVLSTTHAMTNSQPSVDSPNKHNMREGRAASHNIVPTSTGAAIAVTKAITSLEDKFDGISLRVPVIAGSIVDVTFVAKKPTSVEEVNAALTAAAHEERWQKVFSVSNEPLVSTDIIGAKQASIADLGMTRVVDGTLVKVLAWYDNEMGYTHALIEHVVAAGALIQRE